MLWSKHSPYEIGYKRVMYTTTVLALVLAVILVSSIILTVFATHTNRRERKRRANQQQVNKVLKKGAHYAGVGNPQRVRAHLAQAQELDTKLMADQDTLETDEGPQKDAQRRSWLYRFFFGP
jgi:uncharacterized membrane-anchored protein